MTANPIKGFKLGDFKVLVSVENNMFVGKLFYKNEESGVVTSKKSHFDCALKGIAYLKTLNDMPSNYEWLPDTGALCLQ